MEQEYIPYIKIAVIGIIITGLLSLAILLHYQRISGFSTKVKKTSVSTSTATSVSAGNSNEFSVASDTPWVEVNGNSYPYSFQSPSTLILKTFPNDAYDIYAISWKNMPPDQNVLIGVDNLKNDAARNHFISEPKINYVREWYKQFGLKGVSSIDTFINSMGLKGYKAKYFNSAGVTSNTDVFFEIPKHPEYVIHAASGVLSPAVFEKIIDSIKWKNEE
jgi:hypothetical protein